jgi:hypothetical protein
MPAGGNKLTQLAAVAVFVLLLLGIAWLTRTTPRSPSGDRASAPEELASPARLAPDPAAGGAGNRGDPQQNQPAAPWSRCISRPRIASVQLVSGDCAGLIDVEAT